MSISTDPLALFTVKDKVADGLIAKGIADLKGKLN